MAKRLSDERLDEIAADAAHFDMEDEIATDVGYGIGKGLAVAYMNSVDPRTVAALVAEVRAAREREAAIIGTGQIVTLAIEDGRRALTSWCSLGDCECPVHEEPAPPAGTYVTVRMGGDPAVKFGRVRITWEPVTGGDDDG